MLSVYNPTYYTYLLWGVLGYQLHNFLILGKIHAGPTKCFQLNNHCLQLLTFIISTMYYLFGVNKILDLETFFAKKLPKNKKGLCHRIKVVDFYTVTCTNGRWKQLCVARKVWNFEKSLCMGNCRKCYFDGFFTPKKSKKCDICTLSVELFKRSFKAKRIITVAE